MATLGLPISGRETEETGRDGRIWSRDWYKRLIQRGSNSYGIFGTSRITINSWNRSSKQFFETWKRAVRTIRRVNPKAVIVGPSLANGPCNYLYGFLLSAHAHNVLPDIISWHDMDLDHPNNVVNVRQFMANHGIPDRPISINEFRYSDGTHRPGLSVWWLSHIEEEAPESAAYSCWPDQRGTPIVRLYTLDGLLTRDGVATGGMVCAQRVRRDYRAAGQRRSFRIQGRRDCRGRLRFANGPIDPWNGRASILGLRSRLKWCFETWIDCVYLV